MGKRRKNSELSTQTASKDLIIQPRDSLLTSVLNNYDLSYIYRNFACIVVILYVRTFLREIEVGYSGSYGFGMFISGLHDFPSVVVIWSVIFATSLLVHPFLCIWGQVRIKFLPKHGTFRFVWDATWFLTVSTYLLCVIFLPMITRGIGTALVSNMVLIEEQVRISMKVHAYVRSNVPKFLAGSKVENPRFSSYVYYHFAPTLIYQEVYPRTKSVNWGRLKYMILEFFGLSFLFSTLGFEIFDTFKDFDVRKQPWTSITLVYIKSMFLTGLLYHLSFYTILHSWLNIWAELLQFPDRQFYQDWWNAKTVPEFFRKWNTIIYAYIHTYLYKDLINVLGSKSLAGISALLVSGIFHELVLAASLGIFVPTSVLQMCVLPFVIKLLPRRWLSDYVNVQLIMAVFLIKGFDCFIWSLEYFARSRCKDENEGLSDYFSLKLLTCRDF